MIPVKGWNQCAKCVAPCSMAHSFMVCATEFATSAERLALLMVLDSFLYVSEGRRCFITCSEKTIVPYFFVRSVMLDSFDYARLSH
ncbi:MAG: hypothetical protein ACLT98_09240 [Eggerthellaceae bacterium]